MVKYFVSHSEKDKEYSEAFVDLLRLGLEIDITDIDFWKECFSRYFL